MNRIPRSCVCQIPPETIDDWYKSIARVTLKMSSIVKESFTIKSRISRFVLPILGWVYLLFTSDNIKSLISNGYTNTARLNQSIYPYRCTTISCVGSLSDIESQNQECCYDTGISIFLGILIVIMPKSNPHKCITISSLL
jgi:hypothetical protein